MKKQSQPEVPLAVWRELLLAALEFRRLKPWEFMADDMAAHVPDDAGSPNFATVLGANGEVFGLVLYRGERMIAAMNDLWADADEGVEPDDEFEFRQNALTLWFGAKDELEWEEKKILMALHYKPRFDRANAWPKFLSHLPNFAPWDLDEAEARLLTDALRRVNQFVRQLEKNPGIYEAHEIDELPTLPADDEPVVLEQLEWRDWGDAGREPLPFSATALDGAGLEKIAALPQDAVWCLETDFTYLSMATDGEGMPRPWFPRLLGVAESGGEMLSVTALNPAEGDDLSVSVARELVKVMVEKGSRPTKILLGRDEWKDHLAVAFAHAGIAVEAPDDLPVIDKLLYQLPQMMINLSEKLNLGDLPGKN